MRNLILLLVFLSLLHVGVLVYMIWGLYAF